MNVKTRRIKRRYKTLMRCDKGALKLCFNSINEYDPEIINRRFSKGKLILKSMTCENTGVVKKWKDII